MKNKKFLIAMLSVCFLASCAFGVACKDKEDGGTSETESSIASSEEEKESDVEVVLNQKKMELAVYDKATLSATVYGSEEAIAWASSAPAVVAVDSEGKVTALAVGEATITATVDGGSASCTVVVKEATTAPVIKISSNDVYLNIGGSFVSEVKTYWKGEQVEEAVTYTWTVVEGQATDVATATGDANEVTFNGLKEGSTIFRVSADVRGLHISQDVNVTVYGNDVSIIASSTAYVPETGYYSLNLATANIEEYKNSEALSFLVYENGVEVKDAQIEWTVEDEEIVKLEGDKIVSANAGETKFVGTCTVNDVTASVTVAVNVVKPIIALVEPTKAVLEVENLSTLTVETELLGNIQSATLVGKEVLASVSGQTITFNKNNMPKLAEDLGEQNLYVATETVIYELPVTLYTMIINDKAEMDSFVGIAKNNAAGEVGIWDGYFVLGNDIDYNGEFKPMTSHNHLYALGEPARSARYNAAMVGFRGVFDGMGYNIDGLAIGVDPRGGATAEAGIFGVINQYGIVRNISFTNAVSRENSGYIAASGGGLIENISITYKQIGIGAELALFHDGTQPRIMSSFFSTEQGVSETAKVRNCFVDASQATFSFWNEKEEKSYKWSSIQLAGKASVMENVVVICPNETLAAVTGSPQTFTSYEELKNDVYTQSELSLWDQAFWTNVNGIPFTMNMVKNIDKDAEISFDAPDVAFVGRDTEIGIIGQYTKVVLAEDYDGVTYKNGLLTMTEEAVGTTVTLVLTSYLNDQVVEKQIAVKKLQEVALNQTEAVFVESTDTTLNLSVAGEYAGENATVYVGTTVVGKGAVAEGKIPVDGSLLSGAGYGETTVQVVSEKEGVYYAYDLKIFYVTKVLKTMADFEVISVRGGDKATDPVITGYYILGNDIDCKGATISANRPASWQSDAVGFRGTFDGNGKKIFNAGIGECGLFGQVGKGAVIKDVTFDNITYTVKNYQRTTLLGHLVSGATIQNVTLNIISYGAARDNEGVPFVEQGLLAARYFNNNVVENLTINAAGCGEIYRLIARGSAGNTYTNVKIYADGYQTIGDTGDGFVAITELPAGIEFIVA